jgi:hypothetical protein
MDYVIVGQSRGGSLLLVRAGFDPDPELDARVYTPDTGELSPVDAVGRYTKFGVYEDYSGAPDALVGLIPDEVFK